MEIFRLIGKLFVDTDEAKDNIDEATDKAQEAEGKMSGAFKKIGAAVAAGFAVQKVAEFGKACIETAASVKATNSQFEQTFAGVEDAATKAIKNVASSSGILETRLKGIGTSIYAFAKTTGMESTEALGLMEEALQVAADSAAYYDRSLEDTTESLKSFLKGNFENDAALGLSCTETTRNAAANKLYGKSFIELSESQKQLTLLQMVKDANELSGAMGQAARESDGWENVIGNLKESMTQLMATIGTPLLQAAVPVVKALSEGFAVLNEKVSAFLQESGITDTFKEWAGILIPSLQQAWETVLKPSLLAIGEVLEKVVLPMVTYTIGNMVKIFSGAWNTISAIATKLKNVFKFEWEIPKLKLPHFTIKPAGWKVSDLLEGSIPKLGVEWYAKGGVLTKPTVFGMNAATGNAMVGGEAGAEAVAPISVLQGYVESSVAKVVSEQTAILNAILNATLQQGANSQPVTTYVQLDGKNIAKSVFKPLQELTKQHGTALVNA